MNFFKHSTIVMFIAVCIFFVAPKHRTAWAQPLSTSTYLTVRWSANGERFAALNDLGQLEVWSRSGEKNQVIYGHSTGIDIFSWSSDGRYIATGGKAGGLSPDTEDGILVWDVTSGQLVQTLGQNDGNINHSILALAWSPDGSRLAYVGNNFQLQVWNTDTWDLEAEFGAGVVTDLAWSPSGNHLAYVTYKNQVAVFETRKYELLTHFGIEESATYILSKLDWGNDQTLVTTGIDNTIRVWDVQTGKSTTVVESLDEQVSSLVTFPDVELVTIATQSGNVYIYDLVSGELLETIRRDVELQDVSWSPDGNLLVIGGGVHPKHDLSPQTADAPKSGLLEIIDTSVFIAQRKAVLSTP